MKISPSASDQSQRWFLAKRLTRVELKYAPLANKEKQNNMANWKESAAESYAQNYKHAIENHEFAFEISEAQEYELFLSGYVELDEWFENNFGLRPYKYTFKPNWIGGTEFTYTCVAYWH